MEPRSETLSCTAQDDPRTSVVAGEQIGQLGGVVGPRLPVDAGEIDAVCDCEVVERGSAGRP